MSAASDQRSAEFLEIADQFKLGALVTESSHPATASLSKTAKRNVAAALHELFTVDDDVVRKYREFVESGRGQQIADTVLAALRTGGNLYFTGCGSTGRLSIQLASIWRDFWQQDKARNAERETRNEDWEPRAFPVMAGGDYALIKAVEGFEDYAAFGRKQIAELGVCAKDVVFAITEGGETSFVIGTAWQGVEAGAKVYFVYNNPDDILCEHVQRSREVIQDARIEKVNLTTGPMGITGSTRMQATSIELAVMVTVLEMVVRELVNPGEPTPDPSQEGNRARARDGLPPSSEGAGLGASNEVPAQFLARLTELHATLKTSAVLSQLAKLVALEESVYRAGRKNNYFADRVGIDMLTDTTERSPTYCTPPFRKFDDATATESWAFLYVPYRDSPTAWERICKRTPRCVDWKADDVRGLVPDDKLARTVEIIGKIGYAELMRFRIGLDGLKNRPPGLGDSAVALVVDAEKEPFFAPDGFQRVQLEEAVKAGARTGLIFVGSEESCREVGEFVAQWNPQCAAVLLPVPRTDLLLDGVVRVGLKMLLNALSTCTMVRLGRVMGNTMIWVVPSNLKLIDRATRYIARLAKLDYVAANRLLFEVIEYVEPRMKADQAYPPVVGLSVLRAKHGLSNEEAEKRLIAELR
jgi:N-acetylmuramic acid 6-phosphate etherase